MPANHQALEQGLAPTGRTADGRIGLVAVELSLIFSVLRPRNVGGMMIRDADEPAIAELDRGSCPDAARRIKIVGAMVSSKYVGTGITGAFEDAQDP